MSQASNLTVNLIELSAEDDPEQFTTSILPAMEKIIRLQPEVILLYTNKENIELLLQQVITKTVQDLFNNKTAMLSFLCDYKAQSSCLSHRHNADK